MLDAPVVTSPVAGQTDEDTQLVGQVSATDADGDTLTYQVGTAAQHGTVSGNAQGQYTYTPDLNFNGNDSFTIKVSDGTALVDAVVNVAVAPIHDAPVSVDDVATVGENQSMAFNLAGNDTDVEDGVPPSLTGFQVTGVSGINLSPANAQSAFAIGQDGQLQFTPGNLFDGLNTGESATVSISYTVKDSAQATSTGNFTLTVNGETDAYVINGTNGTNLLFGTDAIDLIAAKGGGDFVFAGGGADVVNGGAGNDFVFGGAGNDTLRGEAGRDTLVGEDGNDILAGGAGNDLLYGGNGNDIFVFQFGDGRDVVFDFKAGGSDDVIQLDQSVFADFNALMQSGAVHNTLIGAEIAYADGSSMTLLGVSKANLTVDDFRFA